MPASSGEMVRRLWAHPLPHRAAAKYASRFWQWVFSGWRRRRYYKVSEGFATICRGRARPCPGHRPPLSSSTSASKQTSCNAVHPRWPPRAVREIEVPASNKRPYDVRRSAIFYGWWTTSESAFKALFRHRTVHYHRTAIDRHPGHGSSSSPDCTEGALHQIGLPAWHPALLFLQASPVSPN